MVIYDLLVVELAIDLLSHIFDAQLWVDGYEVYVVACRLSGKADDFSSFPCDAAAEQLDLLGSQV